MDDLGNDSNYMLKLVIGVIIGVACLMIVVPLAANAIATQTVADAASNALNSMDTADSVLPASTSSVIPRFADAVLIPNGNPASILNNSSALNNSGQNVAVNNSTNTSTSSTASTDNTQNTENSSASSTASDSSSTASDSSSTAGMKIQSGSITTGSSLSSKSVCKVYVGSQYSGSKIKMRTVYSRDGSNLNHGNIITVTVSSNGYATLTAADSYKYYPDACDITIYDTGGNVLDNMYVTLSPKSGTQSF